MQAGSIHKYMSIHTNNSVAADMNLLLSREIAKATNVGQCLERLGKELLGPAYKDPITSFSAFQKFSVENPKVINFRLYSAAVVK